MKQATLRHPIEYGVYRCFLALIRCLPHTANRRLGALLGGLGYHLAGSRKRTALANLAVALPETSEAERKAIARGSFQHLGSHLLDTLSATRFSREQFCRRTRIEGWENLLEAEKHDRGVFLMSAHLGAWEAAALPVGLYRGSFHIVHRPLDNPQLNEALIQTRERFGNTMIDKRGATRKMLACIKNRDRIGILIDQRVPPNQGEPVTFFGHPANTSQALARMAIRHGVPVVPLFGYLEADGGYRVSFGDPILPTVSEASDEGAPSTVEQTRLYLEVVEAEVRRHPASWLWMHDRWGLTRRKNKNRGAAAPEAK